MANSRPPWLASLLRSRCPHCRRGPIYLSRMHMAPTCAVCGTKFEREHGYFLNAIFVAYAIYGVLFAPIALYGYFTQRFLTVTIFFVIAILLLAPFTFRYSRVLWLYFDEAMDPRPEPIPDAE